MKNKSNFIPKKYRQPSYYDLIFNSWNAVYEIGGGKFYIEHDIDWHNPEISKGVFVLSQRASCRANLHHERFSSIKKAIEYLEFYLKKQEIA